MNTSHLEDEDEDDAPSGQGWWASVTRCGTDISAQKRRVSVVGGWKRWWSDLAEPRDHKPRFRKAKWSESHCVMSDSLWPHGLFTVHGILQARILEWIAFPFSMGVSPTQGSDSGLLHCRHILNQLSHKGSPRIQEWVAYPFSSGSSQPRNQTRVSCIAGGFFTNWAMRNRTLRIKAATEG